MRAHDENLMRFVRGVHRRLVFMRAAERSGACVGVASIFACAFASVAFIQGREAMQPVLALLAIGAICGIFWGLSRRPTRFEAIVEADRQLNLSDLLASAYAQRDSDDPWQRAVVAIADARCRSLAPSQVIVHRYGGRAWGGIGLAAATGLTLALLSGVPQDSRARTVAARSSPAAAGEVSAEAADPGAAAMAESPSSRSRDEMNSARHAGAVVESGSSDVDPPQSSTSDNTLARTNDAAGARARAGAGEKSGQSAAASGDALPRPANHGEDNASADATATPAGGGGATAGAPAKEAPSPGGGKTSADRVGSNQQSPPWSSPSWDADRAAAGEAMRTGRVPDRYRDVVSEYFRPGDRDTRPPVSPR